VATILLNLLSAVLGVVGMLLFFVGIYPVAVLTMAAGVHYRSQVYAAYLARGGAPLPAQALDGGPPSPTQAYSGSQPFAGAGSINR
jgi:hypothetical protein